MTFRSFHLELQQFFVKLLSHLVFFFFSFIPLPYFTSCLCVSLLVSLLPWSWQYDFSLERRSVRWGMELAEARAAEARAAEAAAAARQEAESRECLAQSQDIDGGGGKRPRPAGEDQDPPPPALNPVLAGLSHNAILTPLPAPSLGPRKTQPSTPQPHSLNLADFEREEDPFDKLELKTLDDKEELRNILQSQPQPQPPPSVSSPEAIQLGPASRGSSPSPPSTNTSLSSKPGFTHKPNGLVNLLDMDRAGHPGRGGLDTDDRPCNIRSLTFPKLSDPGDSDPAPVGYTPFPVPVPAPRKSLPNGSPPTLPKSHVIVGPEPPSHTKSGEPKQVSMLLHFACLNKEICLLHMGYDDENQHEMECKRPHNLFNTVFIPRPTQGQALVCRAEEPFLAWLPVSVSVWKPLWAWGILMKVSCEPCRDKGRMWSRWDYLSPQGAEMWNLKSFVVWCAWNWNCYLCVSVWLCTGEHQCNKITENIAFK